MKNRMLLGFFLAIAGMLLAMLSRPLGLVFIWLGVVWAWVGMALAIERKPWSPMKQRAVQVLVGAAAVAIAMTPTLMPPRAIFIASLLGAMFGLSAKMWLWFFRR